MEEDDHRLRTHLRRPLLGTDEYADDRSAGGRRRGRQAALGPREWIGPFVEGKANFVKGTGTVFVGVKGSGRIPGVIGGVSAKEGVFVTVGSTGIKDAGLRVTTTGSFGTSTGHSVDIKGPGYTLGFVSGTIDFQ